MFCPSSVDYGNVADWAAALGSFAAVATALGIALHQHHVVIRDKKNADNLEHERMAQLKAEVMRIAGEIEIQAKVIANTRDKYALEDSSLWHDTVKQIALLRERLTGIQGYPISDPVLFAAIGKIAYESQPTEVSLHRTAIEMRGRMALIARNMVLNREELAGVPHSL